MALIAWLRALFARISFRQQLFVIFSAGVLLLAAGGSMTTAWLTGQRISTMHVRQGMEITAVLARQSVLALLYASPEHVLRAVEATLSFPAIGHVAVLDHRNQPLLQRGAPATPALPLDQLSFPPGEGVHLIREDAAAWHFMAQVRLEAGSGEQLPFALPATESQSLGQVYVMVEKRILHDMLRDIVVNHVTTALLVTLLVMGVLQLSLRRLLRPLNDLATLMQQAEASGPGSPAASEGPPEVRRIADTYNGMIQAIAARDQQLRDHNERLEQEVDRRTHELVQARDAALTLSRHKSEFLANMSHELRTPLQAIIGFADVVRETLEDEGLEESVQDLESVQHNAQQLLAQINDILDFAKSDAGRMGVSLAPVDLAVLIREVGKTVEPVLRANGNRLQLALATGQPLLMDEIKLRQILLNLLGNAAKFTRNGAVTLTLRQQPNRLWLEVADSGIGIAPQYHDLIFDPFRQVEGGETRRFQGAGLGLAITQRLCHLLGGQIQVASQVGAGARFTVTIPLPVVPATPAA